MEVRKWMRHPVQTVKPLDSLQHAREVMNAHRVNQLPVVAGGKLVGIITDGDIREASPSVFEADVFSENEPGEGGADPRNVKVDMVMTPGVLTLTGTTSIIEAARMLRRERIAAIPIVEKGRLVGILTRSDLIDAFIDLVQLEEARESGELAAPTPPPSSRSAAAKKAMPAKKKPSVSNKAAARPKKSPRPARTAAQKPAAAKRTKAKAVRRKRQ